MVEHQKRKKKFFVCRFRFLRLYKGRAATLTTLPLFLLPCPTRPLGLLPFFLCDLFLFFSSSSRSHQKIMKSAVMFCTCVCVCVCVCVLVCVPTHIHTHTHTRTHTLGNHTALIALLLLPTQSSTAPHPAATYIYIYI
jgi:hypothetical protein